MSVAFDIATYLEAGGKGVVGTDIGVNGFMDKANNEIAVFKFSGQPDDTAHGSAIAFEHPRVQVQVRNLSSRAAETLCDAIYTYLRGKMDLTINSHTYQLILASGTPALLGRDEQNRTTFIAEFTIQRLPE
jgi:hypothetical protein